MTKSKIPSIFALFLLLITLISIIFAVKEFQFFTSSAQTTSRPQDVKLTNIKDDSFTVTWLTDIPSIGFIEYSNSAGTTARTPPTSNTRTHLVRISDLNPGNSYSFRINSNGIFFINTSTPWVVQTASTKIATSGSFIAGRVLNKNGFPAKNALVYVDTGFTTFSTTVAESGNWVLSLPALPDSTVLQILVENSPTLIAVAKVDIQGANPVPTIILGNSYDFRNQPEKYIEESPQVSIELP